jgi:hypothetical protein
VGESCLYINTIINIISKSKSIGKPHIIRGKVRDGFYGKFS